MRGRGEGGGRRAEKRTAVKGTASGPELDAHVAACLSSARLCTGGDVRHLHVYSADRIGAFLPFIPLPLSFPFPSIRISSGASGATSTPSPPAEPPAHFKVGTIKFRISGGCTSIRSKRNLSIEIDITFLFNFLLHY